MVEGPYVLKVLVLGSGGAAHGEGQNGAAQRPRLLEHGLAAGELKGIAITEAADSAQGAEVVVEGPVLLREDHDVLDRAEAAGRGPAAIAVCSEGGSKEAAVATPRAPPPSANSRREMPPALSVAN